MPCTIKRTGKIKLQAKWKELRAQLKKRSGQLTAEYVNKMVGDIYQYLNPIRKYINRQRNNRPSIPLFKEKTGETAETDFDKTETPNP